MLKLWLHEARISNYPLVFGPQFFPSALAPTQAAEHSSSAHGRGDTHGMSGFAGTLLGCQGAPGLTLNLLWFIQDSKDRGPPQSTEEWLHNLWCPFASNGAELGELRPEAG